MISTCLLICGISLLAASLSELVSYLLIYRKDDYKRLKSDIERTYTTLEKRSEEHTSELQSLMRNSYAVFCLKKKKKKNTTNKHKTIENTINNKQAQTNN